MSNKQYKRNLIMEMMDYYPTELLESKNPSELEQMKDSLEAELTREDEIENEEDEEEEEDFQPMSPKDHPNF